MDDKHDPYTKIGSGGQCLPPFSSLTPGFPRPQQQQPYNHSLPPYHAPPEHVGPPQQQQQQQQYLHHQHIQQFSPLGQHQQQSQVQYHHPHPQQQQHQHHQQHPQQQFHQGEYPQHQWQYPQHPSHYQHVNQFSPVPAQNYMSPQQQLNSPVGNGYNIHPAPHQQNQHQHQHHTDVVDNFPPSYPFYPHQQHQQQQSPLGGTAQTPQPGQSIFPNQTQHQNNYAGGGRLQVSTTPTLRGQLFSPDSVSGGGGGQPSDHVLEHHLSLGNVHPLPEGGLPSSTDHPPQIPLSQIESILSTAEQPHEPGSDTSPSLPQLFDDMDQLPSSWHTGFDQIPVGPNQQGGGAPQPSPSLPPALHNHHHSPQGALPSFNSFSSYSKPTMQSPLGTNNVKPPPFMASDGLSIPHQGAQMNGFPGPSAEISGWAPAFHNNYSPGNTPSDNSMYPMQRYTNTPLNAQVMANKFPSPNGPTYAHPGPNAPPHLIAESNPKPPESVVEQKRAPAKKPRKPKKKKEEAANAADEQIPAKPKPKKKPRKKADKEKEPVTTSVTVNDEPISPGPCLSPTFIASLSSKRAPETSFSSSAVTSSSSKPHSFTGCMSGFVSSQSSSFPPPSSSQQLTSLSISPPSTIGSQTPAAIVSSLSFPSNTSCTTTAASANRSPSPNPISPGFLASLSASKDNPPPPAKKRNKRATSTGDKSKNKSNNNVSKTTIVQAVSSSVLNSSFSQNTAMVSGIHSTPSSSSVFGMALSRAPAPVTPYHQVPSSLPSSLPPTSFPESLHTYGHLQHHSSEFQYPTPPMEEDESKLASPRPYLSPTFLASLSHQNGPSFSSSSSPSSSQQPTLSPLEDHAHLCLPTPPNSEGPRQVETGLSKEEQTSRILEIIAREKEKQLQVKAATAAENPQEPKKKKKKKSQQQKAMEAASNLVGAYSVEQGKVFDTSSHGDQCGTQHYNNNHNNNNNNNGNSQSFERFPNNSGAPPCYVDPQKQLYPGQFQPQHQPHIVNNSTPSSQVSNRGFPPQCPGTERPSQVPGAGYQTGTVPLRHPDHTATDATINQARAVPMSNGQFSGPGYHQEYGSNTALLGNRPGPANTWVGPGCNKQLAGTPQHMMNGGQVRQFFNDASQRDKARMCGPGPAGDMLHRTPMPYGMVKTEPGEHNIPGPGRYQFNSGPRQLANQNFSPTQTSSIRFDQHFPHQHPQPHLHSPTTNTNSHQWNNLQNKLPIKTERSQVVSYPHHTQQAPSLMSPAKLDMSEDSQPKAWSYDTVSTDLNHLEATVPAALESLTPTLPALLQPAIKQEIPVSVNLASRNQ
ncbi:hypothetical protein EGW08_006461, partial [Elysia chlorotica]